MSQDPGVKRMAPKLVNSITRAVHLCESTLAFGKAEEPAPKLTDVSLYDIVDDIVDSERLASPDANLILHADVPVGTKVVADTEQLYRVIHNLVRNARQALIATGQGGEIKISFAENDDSWQIRICDTGPGLPPKALEHLFKPFQGGMRKGGTGLGLAISSELIRGHGGELTLESSNEAGTVFKISLPKDTVTEI